VRHCPPFSTLLAFKPPSFRNEAI